MAPTNMAVRSRRTQSYSLSSDIRGDIIPLRLLYQMPEDDDLRKSPRTKSMTTPVTGVRTSSGGRGDASGDSRDAVSRAATSRAFKPVGRKMEYDSDSCLTPRSRRTLRRTLTGVTEPWPSVSTPATHSTLSTIYSPTHEILHPMQTLLLEKTLSVESNKSFVPFLTVRTGSQLASARATQSADFDRRRLSSPKRKTSSFKLESHPIPEPVVEEVQLRDEDTVASNAIVLHENHSQAPKNIVVIIVDAEKPLTKFVALDWAIDVAARLGDEIVILGVLKNICSPHGYKVVANTDPVTGVNQGLLRSEVQRHVNIFEENLYESGRRAACEKKNVKLTVRVAPGARARTVVVRELAALKATYAVFDRRVVRGSSYYTKHLSCHAVRMRSNGRSTKTIFTAASQTTMTPPTPTWNSSSDSPTSSSDTSGSSSSSPTFWHRFTPFKSNRNKWSPTASTVSPRSSISSDVASPAAGSSMNMDAFMSEMQDFSISLDRSKGVPGAGRTKLALQSCVVADAHSYKQGMDSHRIKHRPMSVSLPSICAA